MLGGILGILGGLGKAGVNKARSVFGRGGEPQPYPEEEGTSTIQNIIAMQNRKRQLDEMNKNALNQSKAQAFKEMQQIGAAKGTPSLDTFRNFDPSDRSQVVAMQNELVTAGLMNEDDVDGIFGPQTEGAYRKYNASARLANELDPYQYGAGGKGTAVPNQEALRSAIQIDPSTVNTSPSVLEQQQQGVGSRSEVEPWMINEPKLNDLEKQVQESLQKKSGGRSFDDILNTPWPEGKIY